MRLNSQHILVVFVHLFYFIHHLCTLWVFCKCASILNSHNIDVDLVPKNMMSLLFSSMSFKESFFFMEVI